MTCPPHHYMCETPCGPEIAAQCRLCGEERTFPASPKEEFRVAMEKYRDKGMAKFGGQGLTPPKGKENKR